MAAVAEIVRDLGYHSVITVITGLRGVAEYLALRG
jgi:hypothetical protein